MFYSDGSGVSIEHWNDSWSVDMHCHEYYELMLVGRGSCRHAFHGIETLLIPGDAVLIPAHEAHGYALSGEISLYNCQFMLERLDRCITEPFDSCGMLRKDVGSRGTARSEHWIVEREEMRASALPSYEFNSSKQGVIHLSPSELTFLVSLLEHALELQNEAVLKRKYAEIVLAEVQKAVDNQNRKYTDCPAGGQSVIAAVLSEMENNLTEPFDIAETAERYAFSPNYMRKLFKDFTGVSPIQYLNRLRMIRACACLQNGESIKETAESVGIYDLNYFSRMFKKIIGCSPNKITK